MTSISSSTQPTTHPIFEIEFGVNILVTFTLESFENGTNHSQQQIQTKEIIDE